MNHLLRVTFFALLLVLTQAGQGERTTPPGVRETPAADALQLESSPHPSSSGARLWLPDRTGQDVHGTTPLAAAAATTRYPLPSRHARPEPATRSARGAADRIQPPSRAPPVVS